VQQRPWSSLGGWDEFSHLCIMQTWDYPNHFSEFMQWMHAAVLAGTVVLNDMRYIEWNANKRYMLDLQADGIRIPLTAAMDCSDVACSKTPFGQGPGEPGDMTGQVAVVKPQVGCSALGVTKIIVGEESPVLGPVLLQEFIPSVSEGELSLIFFDGKFSHCVRKMPKACEWRTNWRFGGRVQTERSPPRAALVLSSNNFFDPICLPLSFSLCRRLSPRKLLKLLPGAFALPLRPQCFLPFGRASIASCVGTKLCSWNSS